MAKKENIIKNQNGIASMVIVILIMTLLSLIVVSMTKNANREQRQALDRQLNSQAFYAAESGVNDAKEYYFANAATADTQKNNCNGISGAAVNDQFPSATSIVGADNNRYTCVLYDSDPDDLEFIAKTDESKVMPIAAKNNKQIRSLTFTWSKEDVSAPDFSGCPTNNDFPPSLTDCDAGVLRIELIDVLAVDRNNILDNNFLSFVSPGPSASPSTEFSQGLGNQQGVIWKGKCENGQCTVTINNINNRPRLMLHARSIYFSNNIKISGIDVDGDRVEFKDAQLMVDSTGRAADVLKRIRVRIPLSNPKIYPEFALQTTDDICKRIRVLPPDLSPPEPTQNDCTP